MKNSANAGYNAKHARLLKRRQEKNALPFPTIGGALHASLNVKRQVRRSF